MKEIPEQSQKDALVSGALHAMVEIEIAQNEITRLRRGRRTPSGKTNADAVLAKLERVEDYIRDEREQLKSRAS